MIEKLKEINKLRDEGKISISEADKRKYELVLKDEEGYEVEVTFDKSCTT